MPTFEERLNSMKSQRESNGGVKGLYHANINVLDRETLIDAIKSYGTYAKLFESVWYIHSRTHTAEQCRDYLLQFIDNDDRLGVFDCSNNDFATMRALNKISDLWSN